MRAPYVILIYLLPFLTAWVPMDLAQSIWLWIYAPFAVAMILVVLRRPHQETLQWLCLTPVIFFALLLVVVPIIVSINYGADKAIQAFVVTLAMALPTGAVLGVVFVGLAFGLYRLALRNGPVG